MQLFDEQLGAVTVCSSRLQSCHHSEIARFGAIMQRTIPTPALTDCIWQDQYKINVLLLYLQVYLVFLIFIFMYCVLFFLLKPPNSLSTPPTIHSPPSAPHFTVYKPEQFCGFIQKIRFPVH